MSAAALVLLDIDGTLVRAGDPDHRATFEAALTEQAGRPVTLDGVPLGGNLDRVIARTALVLAGVPPPEVEPLVAPALVRLAELYAEAVGDRTGWLLPGLPHVLHELGARGHLVGVLSGNAAEVGRRKLAAAGLGGWSALGAFGDEADVRHELVPLAEARAEAAGWRGSRRQVVLVGDTPRDVEAAHLAGCPVVAVATGRWSAGELAEHRPDVVLDDLCGLPGAVEALVAAAPGGVSGTG